jgi:hypothetical protein
MGQYELLGAYIVFAFVVFLAAVLWNKHRDTLKKRFWLVNYRHTDEESHKTAPTESPKASHTHA